MLAILCFFAECGLLGKLASQSALDWSLFSWRKTWKKYLLIAGWLNLLSSRLHSAWSLRSYSKRRSKMSKNSPQKLHMMHAPRESHNHSREVLSFPRKTPQEGDANFLWKFMCSIYEIENDGASVTHRLQMMWKLKNTLAHKDTRQNSMNW